MVISDAQIFTALKEKLKPVTLTQVMVDITNIALEVDVSRIKVIGLLGVQAPTAPLATREYKLTAEILLKIHPGANVSVIPFILAQAPNYGIVTKKQMCAFLATCLVESQGFTRKRESFAYSAKRLLQVFPRSRVKDMAHAVKLVAGGQVALANHLYGSRLGNRPGTNDGWDYRGGGIIQNTFRSNYYELQNVTGIPFGDNPKLIEISDNAIIAAMTYWKLHNINELASLINVYKDGYTLNTLNSKGVETKDFEMNTGIRMVRKAVNGGFIGLDEVAETFQKCMRYM